MSVCVSWSTEHGCTRCRNRREVHAIARAVDFAGTADGKGRLALELELERDEGVWTEIEVGDKVKVVMAEKKNAAHDGRGKETP